MSPILPSDFIIEFEKHEAQCRAEIARIESSNGHTPFEEIFKCVAVENSDEPKEWLTQARVQDSMVKSMVSFRFRGELVGNYSWAVPSDDALKALVRHSPIIEIGAGTGYWGRQAQNLGADVLCFDKYPPITTWHPVYRGSVRPARAHSDRSLFLCWPPYGHRLAFEALRAYRGKTVIYVGEQDGCTGDRQFHQALERDWTEIERIWIPRWWGIYDAMYVFTRN